MDSLKKSSKKTKAVESAGESEQLRKVLVKVQTLEKKNLKKTKKNFEKKTKNVFVLQSSSVDKSYYHRPSR